MAPNAAVALGYIRPPDVILEPKKHTGRPRIGARNEDNFIAFVEYFIEPHGSLPFL
jgi:hypothetical protein